jgi:hypothetical protein
MPLSALPINDCIRIRQSTNGSPPTAELFLQFVADVEYIEGQPKQYLQYINPFTCTSVTGSGLELWRSIMWPRSDSLSILPPPGGIQDKNLVNRCFSGSSLHGVDFLPLNTFPKLNPHDPRKIVSMDQDQFIEYRKPIETGANGAALNPFNPNISDADYQNWFGVHHMGVPIGQSDGERPRIVFFLGTANTELLKYERYAPRVSQRRSFYLPGRKVGFLFVDNEDGNSFAATFLHELAHVLGLADRYWGAIDEAAPGPQQPNRYVNTPKEVTVPMDLSYIQRMLASSIGEADDLYDPYSNLMTSIGIGLTPFQRSVIAAGVLEPNYGQFASMLVGRQDRMNRPGNATVTLDCRKTSNQFWAADFRNNLGPTATRSGFVCQDASGQFECPGLLVNQTSIPDVIGRLQPYPKIANWKELVEKIESVKSSTIAELIRVANQGGTE